MQCIPCTPYRSLTMIWFSHWLSFVYLNDFLSFSPFACPVLSKFFNTSFIFMKPFSHLGFFRGAKFPNSILKNKELEKELLLGQHKAYLATTQHGLLV